MVVWLTADVASYGSYIEVGLGWGRNIPIISIEPTKHGRRSAFVAHISTLIADNLEDALDWIAQYMMVP